MNKTEKDYTVQRVKEVSTSKTISCECEKPDIEDFLTIAAVKGELTLKSPTEIFNYARAKALAGGRSYDKLKLKFEGLFEPTPEYIKAMEDHTNELAKHALKNARIEAIAASIVDKINLNKYDDGETAIAEMMSVEI